MNKWAGKQLCREAPGVPVDTELTMKQQCVLRAKEIKSTLGCIRNGTRSRWREGISPSCSSSLGGTWGFVLCWARGAKQAWTDWTESTAAPQKCLKSQSQRAGPGQHKEGKGKILSMGKNILWGEERTHSQGALNNTERKNNLKPARRGNPT